MGGSKSSSSNKSTTQTTTTTEQKDQRVAVTDSGIGIGAGASNVTIDQLPEGLDTFIETLVDAVSTAGGRAFDLAQAAVTNSQQSVEADDAKQKNYQKLLLIGLGGLLLIALVVRGDK